MRKKLLENRVFRGSADDAAEIVGCLVERREEAYSENRPNAVGAIARESGLGAGFIRDVIRPSRRQKTIDWTIWQRVVAYWERVLKDDLDRIEHELKIIEMVAERGGRALPQLVARAAALKARLEALLL